MEKFFETISSEYGLFAGLFVITLIVFAKYVDRHHKETVKLNNGLGKRLNDVEKYVKESLLDVLIDTRAVLKHSTMINEIAIRELDRRCPECELDMTESQVITKMKLEEISGESQKLKKFKKPTRRK